ncbi:MAG: DUF4266 domain-containing protein [Campylobacteraceae bacterium]|nr:DUF4266 domain-containing protein [Campylobacteraceae bacterium]
MILKLLLAVFIIVSFQGCTSKVKAWEKGILAEKHMQIGGGSPLLMKVNEHVFTSKEGSFGGGGIGGGGCGCN